MCCFSPARWSKQHSGTMLYSGFACLSLCCYKEPADAHSGTKSSCLVKCKIQLCFGGSNDSQHICIWSAGLMRVPAAERRESLSPGLPTSSRGEACLLARSWPLLSHARLQGSYNSALLHLLESGLPQRLFQVSDFKRWRCDSPQPGCSCQPASWHRGLASL